MVQKEVRDGKWTYIMDEVVTDDSDADTAAALRTLYTPKGGPGYIRPWDVQAAAIAEEDAAAAAAATAARRGHSYVPDPYAGIDSTLDPLHAARPADIYPYDPVAAADESVYTLFGVPPPPAASAAQVKAVAEGGESAPQPPPAVDDDLLPPPASPAAAEFDPVGSARWAALRANVLSDADAALRGAISATVLSDFVFDAPARILGSRHVPPCLRRGNPDHPITLPHSLGLVPDPYFSSLAAEVHAPAVEARAEVVRAAWEEAAMATVMEVGEGGDDAAERPPLPHPPSEASLQFMARESLHTPGYPSVAVGFEGTGGELPVVDPALFRYNCWAPFLPDVVRPDDAHPDLMCGAMLMEMATSQMSLAEHKALSRHAHEVVGRVSGEEVHAMGDDEEMEDADDQAQEDQDAQDAEDAEEARQDAEEAPHDAEDAEEARQDDGDDNMGEGGMPVQADVEEAEAEVKQES